MEVLALIEAPSSIDQKRMDMQKHIKSNYISMILKGRG